MFNFLESAKAASSNAEAAEAVGKVRDRFRRQEPIAWQHVGTHRRGADRFRLVVCPPSPRGVGEANEMSKAGWLAVA